MKKLSLDAISRVLSRNEMRKIMAGSPGGNCINGHCVPINSPCPGGQVIWYACTIGGVGFPGSQQGVMCCNA